MTDQLKLERRGVVSTVILNNPSRRNALSMEMWAALPEILFEAVDAETRVLVLRGAEGHFCAGADINDVAGSLADAGVENGYRERNARAEATLANFARPTIAAIEGNCVGGGVQLAVACDIRIATSSATFGITPSKLGVTYPPLALLRIASLIGPSQTKRLIYTAELFSAQTALDLGLIDLVVTEEEFEAAVAELADTMASKSLLTQLATKALIDESVLHASPDKASIDYWEDIAREASDLAEGVAAFRDRRAPQFSWLPGS